MSFNRQNKHSDNACLVVWREKMNAVTSCHKPHEADEVLLSYSDSGAQQKIAAIAP